MRPLPAALLFACSAVACAVVAEPSAGAQATTQPATQPAAVARGFDPQRHMRVDEVRPGMKGYGLSVFEGTKIDRFNVEVISVLRNVFGPQQDVVMIRCTDDFMKRYGGIAGCSGSPIYLYDQGESGPARMIGAYAYGWDFAKEPIIGIQPIQYMLTLERPTDAERKRLPSGDRPLTWSLLEANAIPALSRGRTPSTFDGRLSAAPLTAGQPRLRKLMTPLAVSGIGQSAIDRFSPALRAHGLEPLAGAGGGTFEGPVPKFEPGSVLAGALLTGDLQLTALGTCTDVIGDRAYGFGHPFNSEGATSIPMGTGAVNLVVPTLNASFKMGSIATPGGAIDMDGSYGVAGQIGGTATTFPISVEVSDGGRSRTFNYRSAIHRMFTPMLVGTAMQAALVSDANLPVEHTIRYSLTMTFEGGRSFTSQNVSSSLGEGDPTREVVWPVQVLMNNPFETLKVQSVTAAVKIERGVTDAEVLSATTSRPTYEPGETARINLRLRRYKGEAFTHTIDVPLPKTLAESDYTITVGDAATHMELEAQGRPYRFAMRNIDELFGTVQTLVRSGRNDALYVRLIGLDQGVSIGRVALNRLPPSRRSLLQAAQRPDTAAVVESDVIVVPMPHVIRGRADVTVHVKKRLP